MLLLFVLSLNLLNKFYYITIVIFAISAYTFLSKKKALNFSFDINIVYIFLFSTFYAVLNSEHSRISLNSMAHDLLYFLGYFCGYVLINNKNIDYEDTYNKNIFIMTAGCCIHGLLNTISNLKSYGLNITARSLPDYWTGEIWVATGQATMFVLIVGYSFYGIFLKKTKHFTMRILSVIFLFIAIFYNLYTASRTILVILIIVYIISIIGSLNFKVINNKMKYIIIIAVSILFIAIVYLNNIFGIREFVESMPLFNRLSSKNQTDLVDDDRINRWKFALNNFWKYPFGGLNIRRQISYIHNFWLDAYDVAGIVPLFFLLLYTIRSMKNALFIIISDQVNSNFKVLIAGVYISFLLQFMVEPILTGVPWLFILFCIITGMTDRYSQNIRSYECSKGIKQ